MSEIANPTIPVQSSTSEAELAAAFGAKVPTPQVEGQQQQVGQEVVEPNLDPSRPADGTTPSRTEGTPSREELLASLTWDEITNLEHLKSAKKSEIDREAARELKGKEKVIEDRVRQETSREYWKKHFEDMDEDTLAETIRTDPNARLLYAQVTTPTPPPPETIKPDQSAQTIVDYFANIIQQNNVRVQKLPDEFKMGLDPAAYTKAHPDMEPNMLIAQWQGEIADAEVKVKLAEAQKGSKLVDDESKLIDDNAKNQSDRRPLIDGGKDSATVLPDYGTRSEIMLEDAFARRAVSNSRS